MSRKERLQTLNCHSKSYLDYDQLYSLNEKLILPDGADCFAVQVQEVFLTAFKNWSAKASVFSTFSNDYVNATSRVLGLMTYSYLSPGVIP